MTDTLNASLEARDLRYAARLAEMIRCRTVSKKDGFEPAEFLKLRQVIAELFPLTTERAELTILGDDAYLYKLAGTDATRNVIVMSHHDVVDAAGDWQEPPFGGDSRDGKLWGRGTVDTKTPLFAEFTAIEELLEAGFVFPVNVYLFSSCSEEIGGNGAPLALEYFRKSDLRFDWIIDEGGAVIDPPMAGIDCKCAMMAVHEKRRCTARLIAKNLPGHAGLGGTQDLRHAYGGLYRGGGREEAVYPAAPPGGTWDVRGHGAPHEVPHGLCVLPPWDVRAAAHQADPQAQHGGGGKAL